MHEFDLRLEPGPVQGADQVGGEHEGPAQYGDDKQVLWAPLRNLFRQRIGARGNRGFVK